MSNDAASAIGKEPKWRKVFLESDRQILIEVRKYIFLLYLLYQFISCSK